VGDINTPSLKYSKRGSACMRGCLVLALATLCRARHCGRDEVEKRQIHGCTSLKHTGFIGHRNAIWLGHALHHNVHLRTLDLHNTRFGDDDAIAIADGLRNNTHLKRLHMYNNRIHDPGIIALGHALLENDCLEFLSLGSNGCTDKGARALADGLKGNRALRRLDLYFQLIADEGAIALAEALKVNRGLRMLHLDNNRIEEAGGVALAEAVHGSPAGVFGSGWQPSSLGELGLMYNPMGDKALEALIEAAKANPTMHKLGLDHIQGVPKDSPADQKLKQDHIPRMHHRHKLARWLVHSELIDSEGFSDEHLDRELADPKRGHGGWHSADGPPLASDLAPAAEALKAHTHEGLLALRHTAEAELKAHPALSKLTPQKRDALVKAVLAAVQHAISKDET